MKPGLMILGPLLEQNRGVEGRMSVAGAESLSHSITIAQAPAKPEITVRRGPHRTETRRPVSGRSLRRNWRRDRRGRRAPLQPALQKRGCSSLRGSVYRLSAGQAFRNLGGSRGAWHRRWKAVRWKL